LYYSILCSSLQEVLANMLSLGVLLWLQLCVLEDRLHRIHKLVGEGKQEDVPKLIQVGPGLSLLWSGKDLISLCSAFSNVSTLLFCRRCNALAPGTLLQILRYCTVSNQSDLLLQRQP